MPTRQFTAKTVDEATDLALETLGLNREEVEIVVVNPGRSGILGFGGEPAEIHVTPIDEQVGEAPPVEAPPTEGDEVSEERPPRRSRGGRNRRGRGRGRAGLPELASLGLPTNRLKADLQARLAAHKDAALKPLSPRDQAWCMVAVF